MITDTDFESRVHGEVMAAGGPNQGFPYWYFKKILELEDSDIAYYICDPNHDYGLDAFYADDDFFYLFQFKYHHPAPDSIVTTAARNPANELRNCWPVITDVSKADQMRSSGTIRETLRRAAHRFKEEVIDGSKKAKLVIVEFTKGDTDPAEEWYTELARDLVKNEYFADPPVTISNFHSLVNDWTERYIPSSRLSNEYEVPYINEDGILDYLIDGSIDLSTHHIGDDPLPNTLIPHIWDRLSYLKRSCVFVELFGVSSLM